MPEIKMQNMGVTVYFQNAARANHSTFSTVGVLCSLQTRQHYISDSVQFKYSSAAFYDSGEKTICKLYNFAEQMSSEFLHQNF